MGLRESTNRKKASVLLVGDLGGLFEVFPSQRYRVLHLPDTSAALEALSHRRFDLVVVAVYLPGPGGLYLAQRVRTWVGNVGLVLASERVGPALEREVRRRFGGAGGLVPLVRIGALPDGFPELYLGSIGPVPDLQGSPDAPTFPWWLAGSSRTTRKLRETLGWMSLVDDPGLMVAESGTRPAEIARWIHARSRRRRGPFRSLRGFVTSAEPLARRLFGQVRGAFRGADTSRGGSFEAAHRGTLFLEDLPRFPPTLQRRILRALETQEVFRIGGTEPIRVNVRVLASSADPDPSDLIPALHQRLIALKAWIPPLRARLPDLAAILEEGFAARAAFRGIEAPEPFPIDAGTLQEQAWRGNIDQLEACIDDALMGVETATLPPDPLDHPLVPLKEMERHLVQTTLRHCADRKTEAARLLGISRKSLYNHCLRAVGVGE